MTYINKLIVIFFFSIFVISPCIAIEKTAIIDIDYILKNSNIGKNVLSKIEDLNKKNIKTLEKRNKDLRAQETQIKQKKNIISEEVFKNEVETFKIKVQDFTNEKNKIVNEFKSYRKKELENVFKKFNPLISEYMKQNSIHILIDSKNIFMSNTNSNITEDILKIINDRLK